MAVRQQVAGWVGTLTGRGGGHSPGQRRYRRIAHTLLSALFGRGISLLVSLISIPLTLRYLGAERYGAWVVLNTFFTWLVLADFGIGNSLINSLSEAYSQDDRKQAQRLVATAFWLMMGMMALFALGLAALWPWLDWAALLRLESPLARTEIAAAVALGAVIFLVNIPLSLLQKIYLAYQQGYIFNYWTTAGSVLGLLGLWWVTATERGVPWLVAVVPGSLTLVMLLNALYLFGWQKPWLRPALAAVDRPTIARLMATGWWFFLLAVEGIIINQLDSVVILRWVSVEAVAPYSVLFRLFTLAMLPITMIGSAFWAAYAEARVSEPDWVQRSFRRSMRAGLLYGGAAALALLVLARPFIRLWAGAEAVPSQGLVVIMALWCLTTPIGIFVSMLLNSFSRIRVQVAAGALNAAINLPLSIWLGSHFGAAGVAAGTLIASLSTWCALLPYLLRTLRRQREEISHQVEGQDEQ